MSDVVPRAAKKKHTLTSLDDLKPAELNPRDISENAARALGTSLERFGDISGIVWNRRSGRLVAGHQRVQALKEAGAQFVLDEWDRPLLVVSGDRMETFPVRIVDWDKTTEQAACVAANNPHAQGFFLPDDLDQLLSAVRSSDEELFNALAFDEFKLDLDEAADEPDDEREVEEKQVQPKEIIDPIKRQSVDVGPRPSDEFTDWKVSDSAEPYLDIRSETHRGWVVWTELNCFFTGIERLDTGRCIFRGEAAKLSSACAQVEQKITELCDTQERRGVERVQDSA